MTRGFDCFPIDVGDSTNAMALLGPLLCRNHDVDAEGPERTNATISYGSCGNQPATTTVFRANHLAEPVAIDTSSGLPIADPVSGETRSSPDHYDNRPVFGLWQQAPAYEVQLNA